MGWCHEFGIQVREGCDHRVVAGESACHCKKCGVVCKGRFSGCAAVWARGPVAEASRTREGEARHPEPVAASALPSLSTPPSETTELRLLVQALRAELRVLNCNMDQLASHFDQLGDHIGRQLDNVRDQVCELVDGTRVTVVGQPGQGERNPALMAEIDQLIRVVAGTVELLRQEGSPAERVGQNGNNGSNPLGTSPVSSAEALPCGPAALR